MLLWSILCTTVGRAALTGTAAGRVVVMGMAVGAVVVPAIVVQAVLTVLSVGASGEELEDEEEDVDEADVEDRVSCVVAAVVVVLEGVGAADGLGLAAAVGAALFFVVSLVAVAGWVLGVVVSEGGLREVGWFVVLGVDVGGRGVCGVVCWGDVVVGVVVVGARGSWRRSGRM